MSTVTMNMSLTDELKAFVDKPVNISFVCHFMWSS